MKELNNVSLRESLEQLSTSQLDAMLRAELEKDLPDEHAVRLILKVLRCREANYPLQINENVEAACRVYEEKTALKERRGKAPLIKAAVALVVCGFLLFALPQEANARGIFDRIAAWTESIFELFSPDERGGQKEHVFRTEHPGLQEIYDTVTELGVTVPVVPMWIGDGYELTDCKVIETPRTVKVLGTFVYGDKTATYELNIYSENVSSKYHKDEPDAEQYESSSISHVILQNEGVWIVVWTRDNIECSIFVQCQEDDLYDIIDSIYTMEG